MSPAIGALDLSGKLSVANAKAGILVCQSAFAGGTFMDGVEAVDCGNCVAVAPRGSKTAGDWLRDADFEMAPSAYGAVHKGFRDGAQAIFQPLLARIKALGAGPNKPAMFMPHSLGAAEGKFLAMMLHDRPDLDIPVCSVITFGCPRVGGVGWQANYNRALGAVTWDFVNGDDIVPRVPPRWPFGYRLTEQRVFLPTDADGYRLDPPWGTLAKSFFAGLWFAFRAGKMAEGLADPANAHHLENYAGRISKLKQTNEGTS